MRYAFLFLLLFSVLAESREIRVMIIDTGVSAHQDIDKFLQNKDIDTHGHGTHLAGIILHGPNFDDTVCNRVRVISCNAWNGKEISLKKSNSCIRQAIKEKVDVINYSGGGYDSHNHEELILISKFLTMGGIFNTAAGNGKRGAGVDMQTDRYYPASYGIVNSKFSVIGSLTRDGNRSKTSNYGAVGMKWELGENIMSSGLGNTFIIMSGTSQATALYTHKTVKKLCMEVQ